LHAAAKDIRVMQEASSFQGLLGLGSSELRSSAASGADEPFTLKHIYSSSREKQQPCGSTQNEI
jgi:hypothetical protein